MIGKVMNRIGNSMFNKLKRFFCHVAEFWMVWTLLVALCVIALFSPQHITWIIPLEGLFIVYMLLKPMGTVYGLVGASSNITVFLVNFLIITMLFAFVYYGLFFRNAGVCFDKDNPQVDYVFFENNKDKNTLTKIDTTKIIIYEERETDSAISYERVVQKRVDTLTFHRVTLGLIIENSFMTSLTQSPSDFFLIASDFGEVLNTASADTKKTKLFSITLLIHVLISWMFLGVFISLLYSKFRYEA